MNMLRAEEVLIGTRQKIRNDGALPTIAWIVFVIIVDSLVLAFGLHWSVGLIPIAVAIYVKFKRSKNPNW